MECKYVANVFLSYVDVTAHTHRMRGTWHRPGLDWEGSYDHTACAVDEEEQRDGATVLNKGCVGQQS
jgi:hypothetical protein